MNPAPDILFFADCGPQIGGGHVMRCLTLAQALMGRGARCAFVAPPSAEAVLKTYGPKGIEGFYAPERNLAADVGEIRRVADRRAPAWLVIDHYRLGSAEEVALRAPGRRLMVIDDLVRPHDCDLLLDAGYGRTGEDYRDQVPDWTRVLAGPDYALVRPEFLAGRPAALARRRLSSVRRVLVSLGLTDVGGLSLAAAETLLATFGDIGIDVALGAKAPSLAALKRLKDPRLALHVEARDMAGLTAMADVAVGAGGSSTWERACLGLPAVTVILADNQRELALRMQADGLTLAVEGEGPDFAVRLTDAFERLCQDAAARQSMSERLAALCDGRGAERTAAAMLA